MTAARVFCAFMLAGVTFVSGAWVGRMDERARWEDTTCSTGPFGRAAGFVQACPVQIGTPLTVGR